MSISQAVHASFLPTRKQAALLFGSLEQQRAAYTETSRALQDEATVARAQRSVIVHRAFFLAAMRPGPHGGFVHALSAHTSHQRLRSIVVLDVALLDYLHLGSVPSKLALVSSQHPSAPLATAAVGLLGGSGHNALTSSLESVAECVNQMYAASILRDIKGTTPTRQLLGLDQTVSLGLPEGAAAAVDGGNTNAIRPMPLLLRPDVAAKVAKLATEWLGSPDPLSGAEQVIASRGAADNSKATATAAMDPSGGATGASTGEDGRRATPAAAIVATKSWSICDPSATIPLGSWFLHVTGAVPTVASLPEQLGGVTEDGTASSTPLYSGGAYNVLLTQGNVANHGPNSAALSLEQYLSRSSIFRPTQRDLQHAESAWRRGLPNAAPMLFTAQEDAFFIPPAAAEHVLKVVLVPLVQAQVAAMEDVCRRLQRQYTAVGTGVARPEDPSGSAINRELIRTLLMARALIINCRVLDIFCLISASAVNVLPVTAAGLEPRRLAAVLAAEIYASAMHLRALHDELESISDDELLHDVELARRGRLNPMGDFVPADSCFATAADANKVAVLENWLVSPAAALGLLDTARFEIDCQQCAANHASDGNTPVPLWQGTKSVMDRCGWWFYRLAVIAQIDRSVREADR